MGGSFTTLHSYLDLRLDHLLVKINLATNIFEARRLLDKGIIAVSGRIIKTNHTILKPFQWISTLSTLREKFKKTLLTLLSIQRTHYKQLKPLPPYIEPSFSLFRFMLLPLLTKTSLLRPFKTYDHHISNGKTQPVRQ